MPIFLDPTGHTKYAIAICDRCKMKRYWDELSRDPNYPGLMVCGDIPDGCKDQFDPWRLPPRQTENITLRFTRPDLPLQGTIPLPIYRVLAQRLVDQNGNAILTADGQYIPVDIPDPPEPD
jgi:hypothetical protein